MTTVLLVRHAAHDDVGAFLAGRTPGVRLGEAGRAQAARLAARLARTGVDRVRTSPRERTRETAEAIASASGAGVVETDADLDEIDFGRWSGRTFDDLDGDPEWRRWNAVRSLVRTPGGETMLDVQRRAVGALERAAASGAGRVALVSHADVIKAVVAWVLGSPLDGLMRFDIAPASVTVLDVSSWCVRVATLNEVTE